ncbi:SusC/RagA family TonB-linked outer membrane protein [Muricauda sp. 2012CJ35-5]|uniref:SusC/RagA family TonB-linked outer membrane protein n=1 Tax=Flagellimonas spongiicola TaxID=2942208 RepID=A0ABT0PW64_9FLAO|nr:SusC/RagA family TonB-linked outer membrane protein [Allomuricauda spongiicola]MCL6275590.1 SusC/RagA family TonB-linked outer membrane protein [Allomuricauda spongiicola]
MKVKKLIGVALLWMACISTVAAQEKTITGTVTDQEGLELPGVNIVVQGTTNGTQTDFDGNYAINASEGQVLVFTYIGQRTTEIAVGASNTINIQMEEDAQALEEVVVTALGIKREKQALGYAVTEVGSEDLEQRPEGDVARVLQGKASGVQITQQSGLSGSGTNIVIRGQTTFSGSNQALFIVDGVPFSTDTNSQGRNGDRSDFIDGNNGSSRFLDLDPNSIESVNVLKGLAAATLYGSQGRNGVILITTKGGTANQGPKKTEITVNSSLFFNEIASLPDYQNEYGNGFDQSFGWFFSNWGPSFRREGASGWGAQNAIDDNGTLAHPYSTSTAAIQAAFPEFQGARYEWRPYDSVKNFFRTGTVANTSINVRGGSDDGKIGYNMNYGNLKDNGFTPGNSVSRNTLSVGGRAILSNKFTVNGTLNFSRTKFRSPPVALSQGNGATGTGSSIFGDLWFTPRSIDIQGLPYQDPITGGSVYYRQNNSIQHPLWTIDNAGSVQETNRVFGQASVQYELNDNLNIIYRAGIDIYNEGNTRFQNRGGVNSNSGDVRLASGVYSTWNNVRTIWDHNLVINGDYDITEKIGSTFNVGATTRRSIFDQNGVASDGQQVFGVLRHFNFLNQNEIQTFNERNIVGVYAQADFDYDNFVYVTLAARNDWVSNFSTDNRSQFYPSASISFIPTAAIDGLKSQDILNYLKIRGGIGVSANFDVLGVNYPVSNVLTLDTQDAQDDSGRNVVTNTTGITLGNPNLKPETLQEIELGIESRWWDGRITMDASLYKRKTNDLIINRPLDASTGFTNTATNIGEIQSKGMELDLGINWFRAKDSGGFDWTTNLNFTTYETTVEDLGLDTDQVIYSGFSNLGNAAIEGEALGVLYGNRILRDDNGDFVVGADGNYVQDPTDGIIGDPNPDWVANVRNTISYKNFTLGFQWNYTDGGDVYSSTISTLLGRGLITETIDRENTFILPGVDSNGNVNNRQINNSTYFFSNLLFGPHELQVYDATTIRLQEASLSYSLPKQFLDKTPFGNLTFTVSGTNLYFRAFNTPKGANFDPNTSGTGVGNGFGFDFLNGPSSRRYGLSIKASF